MAQLGRIYDFSAAPFNHANRRHGSTTGHAETGADRETQPETEPQPESEAQPEALGEWDFGAANIVASELAPRGWLLGTSLCRQFISSLIGDGAAGKTTHRILCALALATGRSDITGEHVFERVAVLLLCFEDGELELIKRITAAMLHHRISNEDIAGYLFIRAVTGRRLKLAIGDRHGNVTPGPLIAILAEVIVRRRIGAVILDPLVKTHSVDENNNSVMDEVMEILCALAVERDVAVDVPQHVSKGPPDPGNANRARGAGATKNGGRLFYTLAPMSKETAEGFGLDPGKHGDFVRVDRGKVNLTGRADDRTKWFQFVSVPLGNTFDPRYPNGDIIGVLEPWKPPALFEGIALSQIAAIFDQLRRGPGGGEFYAPTRRARDRWAGTVIAKTGGKNEAEARRILATWIGNNVLIEDEYRLHGHNKQCVSVNEAKAAEILGPLYRAPAVDPDPQPDEEAP